MSAQNQNQTKTGKDEKNFIVADFLDLDPEEFTFGAPKETKHGGYFIPIRYKGKALYVRYAARTAPFGIGTNTEEKPEYKNVYPDSKKITSFGLGVSCLKEYEDDPYYLKGQELDSFFMKACHENAQAWGIGGKNTTFEQIEGEDHAGHFGKWKRLLKWSYKTDKTTKERTYLDYPPRFEFGVPTVQMTEDTVDGMKVQDAVFKPVFFDVNGDKLDPVRFTEVEHVMPKFARVSVLAQWSTITIGTYGATLKPKAQQFKVFPSESLATDECLLNDDEEEEGEEHDLGDQFGGSEDVKVSNVRSVRSTSKGKPAALDDENDGNDGNDGEEEEIEVDDGSGPAPTRAAVRPTRRVVTTSRK